MKRITIIVALLFLLLAGCAYGFDGLRKGFVLGGGLGVSPATKWSIEFNGRLFGKQIAVGVDETKTGFGVDFIIGYAWDEKNMIVYHGNGSAYKSEFFGDALTGERNSVQSFSGVSWFHYFGPVGRSLFTAVGIGGYGWKVEEFEMNDPGPGYIIGAGYEFVRHVQAAVYFSGGQTTDRGFDFGHRHLSIAVTAVAF